MIRPRVARRDLVLGLVSAVVGAVWTIGADSRSGVDRPIDALGLGMVVVAALALVVRRHRPVPVLAVVTAATTGYLSLDFPYGPIMIIYCVAVYTVARLVPLHRSAPVAAVCAAVMLTHLLTNDAALPGWQGLIPGVAWSVVPFTVGVSVQLRREMARRERAEQLRRHLDAERLRVAQEVHDIVGHGLAAINMQANVALHILRKDSGDPARVEDALDAISSSSAAALDELRATLALVRRDEAAPRQPAPGLDRVDELCERMRQAGMTLTVSVTGAPSAATGAVGLAAYRTVQEGLTNALRHGTGRTAAVRIEHRPDGVQITVRNPAPAGRPSPGGGGLGIPGMRERVEALGGQLTAGPVDGDRFEVSAWIPAEEHQ